MKQTLALISLALLAAPGAEGALEPPSKKQQRELQQQLERKEQLESYYVRGQWEDVVAENPRVDGIPLIDTRFEDWMLIPTPEGFSLSLWVPHEPVGHCSSSIVSMTFKVGEERVAIVRRGKKHWVTQDDPANISLVELKVNSCR